MDVVACGPESPDGVEVGHAAVLADRRRPGRRDVAPDLVPLLREQALNSAIPDEAETAAPWPMWDELASLSGIMRGIGIASLGWAVVAFLALH